MMNNPSKLALTFGFVGILVSSNVSAVAWNPPQPRDSSDGGGSSIPNPSITYQLKYTTDASWGFPTILTASANGSDGYQPTEFFAAFPAFVAELADIEEDFETGTGNLIRLNYVETEQAGGWSTYENWLLYDRGFTSGSIFGENGDPTLIAGVLTTPQGRKHIYFNATDNYTHAVNALYPNATPYITQHKLCYATPVAFDQTGPTCFPNNHNTKWMHRAVLYHEFGHAFLALPDISITNPSSPYRFSIMNLDRHHIGSDALLQYPTQQGPNTWLSPIANDFQQGLYLHDLGNAPGQPFPPPVP